MTSAHSSPRTTTRRRAALVALGVGATASTLLLAHTFLLKRETDLSDLRTSRRYWEDVCVAAKEFLDHKYAPEPGVLPSARFEEAFGVCQRLVAGGAARQEVRPWQFWRTIHLRPFIWFREHLVGGREFEDPGRAAVLGLLFRLRGGISPFLLLWLGVLALVPVMWWTAWEFTRAGLPVAALLAGVVLGVGALCRAGALALAPGVLLAVGLGGRRLEAGSRGRRWAVLAAAVLLLAAPCALLRRAQHHDVFISLWEGLGDFDRTRGHYFTDEDAQRVLAENRFHLGQERWEWVTDEAEDFFRRSVLGDVASDPAWYARIVLRRLWATVSQEKVRAWTSKDWRAIRDSALPAEGSIAKYYSWTTPVNRIGVGRARLAVPVPLLVLPTAALVALVFVRSPRLAAARAPAARGVAALACVALGAIALPLAVTTASMPETQSFVLVYFLGLALACDVLVRLASPPTGPA